MTKKQIRSNTDQRPFIILYYDFIDSNLLNTYEKMVFIALKRFADDNDQCFPSLKKLTYITQMNKRKVQNTLKSLEQKHIIDIENRLKTGGGQTSNLYTIYDHKVIWKTGNIKESNTMINEIEEKRMIEALTAKGYYISKKKELVSEPTKAHTQALNNNNVVTDKDSKNKPESQVQVERYTLDQIHQLFDYDAMLNDHPYRKKDIDSVMDILHTAMNTTKPTIRISGEDKPVMAVIGKLMKLDKESIIYAIKKFSEQTERIKSPISYMLTILYSAPEQFSLDIQNQVSHDMANWT